MKPSILAVLSAATATAVANSKSPNFAFSSVIERRSYDCEAAWSCCINDCGSKEACCNGYCVDKYPDCVNAC
ncbi:hypothetical protein PGQ11_001390 [Apiospora arundinis]|uniref:Uncharacterized protein n=1 Tax=Apiospora arundinis TaxID=335852 RepID=A0ABR2JMX6_9PEZI